MHLLEDLKMSLWSFNFFMIYIIHKMLLLLKNHLTYLKNCIFECFLKEYNRFLIFLKKIKLISFIINNNRKFKSWGRKHT